MIKNITKQSSRKLNHGFTIVELLIVVVVIAILAAITIVAYNGISSQAKESALKSDLTTASKKLQLAKVQDDTFPATKPADTNTTKFQYSSTTDTFFLTATSTNLPNKAFSVNETGVVSSTACSGHTTGGSGGDSTEIAANSPIQNVTSAQCAALPVFDGSNASAIRTVTDTRGGTTRTYEVAKLADNNCWMLTNLKLGSTTGSITLTPADSNVTANFTLPQVKTTGSTSSTGTGNGYDTPYAYGPVPGDTGAGATNYGYLYNWPAATAGKDRTNHNQTAGNSATSICPANWRLPSGGVPTSDFGKLDVVFGGTGESVYSGAPNIAKWQNNGPFKGIFSGKGWGSFHVQSSYGGLWSSSAYPGYVDYAFSAYFGPGYVSPGGYYYARADGLGVRCLLN